MIKLKLWLLESAWKSWPPWSINILLSGRLDLFQDGTKPESGFICSVKMVNGQCKKKEKPIKINECIGNTAELSWYIFLPAVLITNPILTQILLPLLVDLWIGCTGSSLKKVPVFFFFIKSVGCLLSSNPECESCHVNAKRRSWMWQADVFSLAS